LEAALIYAEDMVAARKPIPQELGSFLRRQYLLGKAVYNTTHVAEGGRALSEMIELIESKEIDRIEASICPARDGDIIEGDDKVLNVADILDRWDQQIHFTRQGLRAQCGVAFSEAGTAETQTEALNDLNLFNEWAQTSAVDKSLHHAAVYRAIGQRLARLSAYTIAQSTKSLRA
jgi:hypothetical protein